MIPMNPTVLSDREEARRRLHAHRMHTQGLARIQEWRETRDRTLAALHAHDARYGVGVPASSPTPRTLTRRKQVIQWLKHHPEGGTAIDIAAGVGISPRSARNALADLKASGRAKWLGRGGGSLWVLIDGAP